MKISEIFYSIQGEGLLSGVPSVFVRTSGCNLRCRWCDTPYASWEPEGENLSPEAVIEQVREHSAARHVVLTGGEPMIARGIRELAALLRAGGYHITIETAGTVLPKGIDCDLASLSPKLANSTPLPAEADAAWIARHEETRIQPATIAAWMGHCAYQLKFVLGAPEDLGEVEAVLASLPEPPPRDLVLLMPEGRDAETLRARAGFLVEICKNTGYRFAPRLQIDLFGDTRGT